MLLHCSHFNTHFTNTQSKISQIDEEIQQLQNKLAASIVINCNQAQLIEQYESVNEKLEKLQMAKQQQQIFEKIKNLESQFHNCIKNDTNSEELVLSLKEIFGSFQDFVEFYPERAILEKLNQLMQNYEKSVKLQMQNYEKEKHDYENDENSEEEGLKPISLQQFQQYMLPSEIEHMMDGIRAQSLSNYEAIKILEEKYQEWECEFEENNEKIECINQEFKKQMTQLWLNRKLSKNILMNKNKNIKKQNKKQLFQRVNTETNQKVKNIKLKIRFLYNKMMILNIRLMEEKNQWIINQSNRQLNIKSISQIFNKWNFFRQGCQKESIELQQALVESFNKKNAFESLLSHLKNVIDDKKKIEFSKQEKEQAIINIRLKAEEMKLQIGNIQKLMEIISQKQNYDEQMNNIQHDQSLISLQIDESQNLECQLDFHRGWQKNILKLIQYFQEKIEIQQKLVDLQTQREEINTNKIEHSCQRESHGCEQYCCQCQGVRCKLQAGQSGNHFCEKLQHQCIENCSIIDCLNACIQYIGHSNIHQCNKIHSCDQKCQYCSVKCSKNIFIEHDHTCSDKQCNKKCFHCGLQCKEDHSHSNQSKENHCCNKFSHDCQHECKSQGFCIKKQIKNEKFQIIKLILDKIYMKQQQYLVYVQKGCKQRCSSLIKAGDTTHSGQHTCKIDTDKVFHTCEAQCPDCNALCIKKYGHEGKHQTQQHRNKDTQCFTQIIGKTLQINYGKSQKFQVGDSAKIENCTQSCENRGRSHFHIIECKGGQSCLERKKIRGARHSKVQYIGYEGLKFDEVLCSQYWIQKNWEHPVLNDEKKNDIDKCNYYCTLCKGDSKIFCSEKAWHSEKQLNNHIFQCQELHLKNKFSSINICFVLDSTGSMEKYLTDSIKAIEQIVQKAQELQINEKKCLIQFSIVAYKDHEKERWTPYKWQNVVKKQDFTDDQKTIKFLKSIKAEGGDDFPEAILDGLYYGIRMSWGINSYRIMYLIADAPPHGKKGERVYHNFDDDFPDGCPCGLKQTPILQQMIEMEINFKIIKLNKNLDMMISEFEKDYKDLCVYQVSNSNEYISKIVDDVCDVLDNENITYDEAAFNKRHL